MNTDKQMENNFNLNSWKTGLDEAPF